MATMVVRFLSGTSLFVIVLTGALAAPVPLSPLADRPVPSPPNIAAVPEIPVAPQVVPPVVPQQEILRQAIAAYEKQDLAGGDALAGALREEADRTVAEWIALRSAPRQAGFKRLNGFLSANPSWPGNGLLRRRAEEALYNDAVDDVTIKTFFATSKPETDEGKIALAAALQRSGDTAGAADLVRDAYRNDALSGLVEADIMRGYAGMLTSADYKFRADRLIYDGDYVDGLRVAARAGDDVVALAKLRVSVAQGAGNAGTLLATTVSDDPAYLFAKAMYLRRHNKAKEAAAVLERAPRDAASLVSPDEWWTQRRLVARALLDQGDARTAYAVVSGYTAESDATKMEAEFHCGWIALRFLKNASIAARHFATLSAESQRPITMSRGAYWQGRAAEAGADKDGAAGFYQIAARYPTTYYGQLALARLGMHTLDLPPLPAVSAATRTTFDNLTAIRAIRQLYAVDERGYARILVNDMGMQLQDSQQFALLGELALDNRDAKGALLVGKSATQRGLPLEAIAFPTGAIPGFEGSGNVERAVVYSIARQESEFGHDAVSGAGARGLMQMMPSTAKATAKAAGMTFDARRLATDPAYNAAIGEAHLGELIDRFRGSYIMTFAAYNAGPGKVADWVKAYGDPRNPSVDPIDWVERIPYPETRNYVQRVLENVQVYRSRLDSKTALLIDSDLHRGQIR